MAEFLQCRLLKSVQELETRSETGLFLSHTHEHARARMHAHTRTHAHSHTHALSVSPPQR